MPNTWEAEADEINCNLVCIVSSKPAGAVGDHLLKNLIVGHPVVIFISLDTGGTWDFRWSFAYGKWGSWDSNCGLTLTVEHLIAVLYFIQRVAGAQYTVIN